MSFPTYLLPQSFRGARDKQAGAPEPNVPSQGQMPAYDNAQVALNGGPPPARVPRQFRNGLSAFSGLSQWSSAQQADGLASLETNANFVNMPPVLIPKKSAVGGINQPLAQLGRSNTLRVPSTFVPAAGFSGQ